MLSVSLRDTHSFNFFKDLENVIYAPDIIFGLADKFSPPPQSRSKLGISVILGESWQKNIQAQYIDNMVNLTRSAIERGIDVVFFSFCVALKDADMVKKISEQLTEEELKHTNHVEYNGDLINFLKSFASMKYIAATRFHSNVLALKFRQALFPIVYDDKTTNLLEDLGVFADDEIYDLRKGKVIDIEKVWNLLDNPKDCNEKIKLWEQLAVNHFTKLDEFFSTFKS